MKQFTIYTRVSTTRQGESQLGLESQRDTCMKYIESKNGKCIGEFQDVQSGRNRDRKGLWEAIDFCKDNDSTLVISKLDRLARDIEFTFKIINTGISIYICDLPVVNTMILGVFASVAEYERELISGRTKSALEAKKKRGEDWTNEYGKNTGTTREESLVAARKQSAISRREKAKNNPANKFFWQFCLNWQEKNKKITANTDFTPIADELNSLEQKTATGLPFDRKRARAAYYSLKNIYQ